MNLCDPWALLLSQSILKVGKHVTVVTRKFNIARIYLEQTWYPQHSKVIGILPGKGGGSSRANAVLRAIVSDNSGAID